MLNYDIYLCVYISVCNSRIRILIYIYINNIIYKFIILLYFFLNRTINKIIRYKMYIFVLYYTGPLTVCYNMWKSPTSRWVHLYQICIFDSINTYYYSYISNIMYYNKTYK